MAGSKQLAISLANEQSAHSVDEARLIEAARGVVQESSFSSADISLVVVDDASMHALNQQYLAHDYPTDVLSFVLDESAGHLQGEVIISADTAAREAGEVGWPVVAEQLLYIIHGTLHLIGYRDKDPDEANEMRLAEQRHMGRFGFEHPPASDDS